MRQKEAVATGGPKNLIQEVQIKWMEKALLANCKDEDTAERFSKAYRESIRRVREAPSRSGKGFVPRVEGAIEVVELATDILVDKAGSKIVYPQDFGQVKRELDAGANVILAANHSNTLDVLPFVELIRTVDQRLIEKVLAIASIRNMDFPVKAAMFDSIDTIQVYGPKDFAEMIRPRDEMSAHNVAAMLHLARLSKEGGRAIIFFPEGRTNKGELMRADPNSSQILELIRRVSPAQSYVYPVAIEGVQDMTGASFTSIVSGGGISIKRAPITVTVGPRMDLNELIPDKKSRDNSVVDAVMLEIARLMPEEKRGDYPIPAN